MYFLKHFKGIKVTFENKGEELLIHAKGSKEIVANLEKKLSAMKELCGDDCCDDESCCGGEKKGGCC